MEDSKIKLVKDHGAFGIKTTSNLPSFQVGFQALKLKSEPVQFTTQN